MWEHINIGLEMREDSGLIIDKTNKMILVIENVRCVQKENMNCRN